MYIPAGDAGLPVLTTGATGGRRLFWLQATLRGRLQDGAETGQTALRGNMVTDYA